VAGLFLSMGWRYPAVMLMIGAVCGLALLCTLLIRFPPSEPTLGPDTPGAFATLRMVFGVSGLLALALVCVLGIGGESIANLWAVIYLHGLGAGALLGGAGFALFNGAMFFGRIGNSWLVGRYGSRVSLMVSGTLLVLAAMLLLADGVAVALVAFVLLGAGVAGVVPTVLSAAALLVPGQNATITSAIMAFAYIGFVICPPLTGWIAELYSLKAALVVVGLSGICIVWLARRIK
jgi:fucose permease